MVQAILIDEPLRRGQLSIAEARGDSADGEVLGLSALATSLRSSPPLRWCQKDESPHREFYQMLYESQGAHLVETLELGTRIDVTPLETRKIHAFG